MELMTGPSLLNHFTTASIIRSTTKSGGLLDPSYYFVQESFFVMRASKWTKGVSKICISNQAFSEFDDITSECHDFMNLYYLAPKVSLMIEYSIENSRSQTAYQSHSMYLSSQWKIS